MDLNGVASLEELYLNFDRLGVEGGWHRKQPALWAEPRPNFLPHLWRWSDVKPALDAAGRLVSTEFAERRNLTMTNPVPGNTYATVRTIVAAYQMMLPGERARSHRHTPNALRLVMQGRGTYTIVDGESLEMVPGDVLLTPNWSWHEHGTRGTESCYWLDYLDVPLVHLLEPMFFERHPLEFADQVSTPADSPMVFRWSSTLSRLKDAGADALGSCHREIELGAPALNTMALHMQTIYVGRSTERIRTTANAVYTVVEGSGTTEVDGKVHRWSRGDTLAVPAWRPYRHSAIEDSVLFRVSDSPVLAALGFLRAEALDPDRGLGAASV